MSPFRLLSHSLPPCLRTRRLAFRDLPEAAALFVIACSTRRSLLSRAPLCLVRHLPASNGSALTSHFSLSASYSRGGGRRCPAPARPRCPRLCRACTPTGCLHLLLCSPLATGVRRRSASCAGCSIVSQNPYSSLNPAPDRRSDAFEQLAGSLPQRLASVSWQPGSARCRTWPRCPLVRRSLPGSAFRRQRQRVALARALRSSLICCVCDESPPPSTCPCRRPSSSYCAACKPSAVLSLLFITHNLPLVAASPIRSSLLQRGLDLQGPSRRATAQRPYATQLLADVPKMTVPAGEG